MVMGTDHSSQGVNGSASANGKAPASNGASKQAAVTSPPPTYSRAVTSAFIKRTASASQASVQSTTVTGKSSTSVTEGEVKSGGVA